MTSQEELRLDDGDVQRGTAILAITDLLTRSYREFGPRPAVVDSKGSLSYADLAELAHRVAHGLIHLGCRPGDRIAIAAPNQVEWAVVEHAAYLSGLVRIGLLLRLHPQEIAQIATDAEPTVIVAEGKWLDEVGVDWIPGSVQVIVSIGPSAHATVTYEELSARVAPEPLPGTHPDDDVVLYYTSGSTGVPKGVRHSGIGVGAMVHNLLTELPDLGPEDAVLHSAPLSHFSGCVATAVLGAGGTNLLVGSFDMDQILSAIEQSQVSILVLVPTQLNMLTAEILRRRGNGQAVHIDSLRAIVYSGSAIAPERAHDAQEVFGRILIQFYGSSEAPLPLTSLHPADHRTDLIDSGGLPRLASAGRPTPNVELRIVGDDGREVPADAPGDIQVRGRQTMRGYWRQPEATDEVMDAAGWISTGDVGYLSQEGYLYIVDRKKDMIVTGGFNVYSREVENAIARLPGVRQVAVVGAPSERWGEEVTAFVILNPEALVTCNEIVDHCRVSIAGYKVPKQVHLVETFPTTATGKIKKQSLADELWAGRDRRV
ncbi:class I adenylate-forming enzyme family protein [Streptomyces sp. NPDC060209]|uniref:class I adenylate-forming enzyme family protein n=1 Tax=Streptomyces sp. NPDC060209 TaxID=3347073 RepID=UPI0036672D81